MFNLSPRLVILWLSATALVAQPAWADLPQFKLTVDLYGDRRPTAEMDGMKVWCDDRRQFVLEYSAEHSLSVSANDVLGFVERPFAEPSEASEQIEMKVELTAPGRIVGRAPVDDKLIRVLNAEHLAILAPTEMGEPLYVGRSEALLEIARQCQHLSG